MRGVRSVLFLGCHVSEGDNVSGGEGPVGGTCGCNAVDVVGASFALAVDGEQHEVASASAPEFIGLD
jgi:hypothetical protein